MTQKRLSRFLLGSIAVGTAIGLVGCSHTQLQPVQTAKPTTAEPTESVDPDSAEGRQSAFDDAIETAQQGGAGVDRDVYVDALVEAGFDTESMEATDSLDSLGAPVTYIEIAVRIGDDCIIGQAGEGGTSSMLAAPLQTGKCLVGNTPPID